MTSAKDGLSERTSVFEHYEVLRDALRHTNGRAQLKDIEAELARQKADNRFTEVRHVRPTAPMFRYTTPELVQIERGTIERVIAGKGQVDPLPAADYSKIMGRYGDELNEDQRRVAYEALASTDQISGLQGRAGTGKTTALSAVVELAEESGYKAQGLGPTSRAAKGLKEAGMDATTLQMALIDRRQGDDARPRMYFVDESSLVASKQMRDFLESIGPRDRVLLIGDTRQHQSIEAGRIFGQLQESGMKTAELSEIVRQKDPGLKQVVEHLAAGRVVEGVELLQEQNRVHSVAHRGERFKEIAKAYMEAASLPREDGKQREVLVVSPDNASRKEINMAVREEMRNAGKLKEDAFELPIHVNRQNVTTEGRRSAETYHVGDSIRYLRGSEVLKIEPKSYATVLSNDTDQNIITVKTDAGKVLSYDPARLTGVTIYAAEIRSFAEGDRVQFTAPWRDQGIATRDTGTVTHLDNHGNIRVRLDESERTIGWNLNRNKHLDHAYAMTSHSSQGATVDNVLVHVDTSDSKSRALIDETLGYVALSGRAMMPKCSQMTARSLPRLFRGHTRTQPHWRRSKQKLTHQSPKWNTLSEFNHARNDTAFPKTHRPPDPRSNDFGDYDQRECERVLSACRQAQATEQCGARPKAPGTRCQAYSAPARTGHIRS